MKWGMPLRRLLLLFVLSCGSAVVFGEPAAIVAAPKPSTWFTASLVAADTWGIVDHGVVNCYLVVGRDRALLIDVGYGDANLRDYVKSITALPLTVINTHGHRDHSGADVQFGAVLAHPADFAAIERNASPEQRERNRTAPGAAIVPAGEQFDFAHEAKPLALQSVKDGDVIDLGGRQLEIIGTPGHTAGEIVLLDRQEKVLFAGDHINRLVWLQLPGCLPLATYLANLEKVAARSAEFTMILPGHHEPIDSGYLAELIACVKGIVEGTIADEPYTYGQTSGRIAKHQRASVVFDPSNLRTPAPAVATESGALAGLVDPSTQVAVFKGVPFAAPPVGPLRWREPQPVVPWEGVRAATGFGPSPMQRVHGDNLPWTVEYLVQNEVSEDCLYLNVWTPKTEAGAKLPVIVYIPGGAFTEGSGAIPIYDGARLAARGLVVVTVNYRLGIFGFFAHPALTAESPHHATGNYGLLDQVAALAWVQRNILAFGGDPARVTVWGQSAGAFSVGALLASPRAKGLFQRAFAASGLSVAVRPMKDRATAEQDGVSFASERGAADLKALRALPAADLVAAMGFRPIVDGWLLTDTPNAVNAAGAGLDVPVMTGFMANDPLLSLPKIPTLAAYDDYLRQTFGSAAVQFKALYPVGDLEAMRQVLLESARDRQRVAAFLWARQRARSGKSPVFTYHFERGVPWPAHREFGAFHSGELPYFFDNLAVLPRPWEPADRALVDTVAGYLKQFAATGNPNGPGLPAWPAVEGATPLTQRLAESVQPTPLAIRERFEFWLRYFESEVVPAGNGAAR